MNDSDKQPAAPMQAPPDAQVADLLAQARREAAQSAQAIADLCTLAGCPQRAAEFIAAGASEAQVRRTLMDDRAAASQARDIRSTITTDAGVQPDESPEGSAIVAAVKRRIGRA